MQVITENSKSREQSQEVLENTGLTFLSAANDVRFSRKLAQIVV
jgi:hypothetical protein